MLSLLRTLTAPSRLPRSLISRLPASSSLHRHASSTSNPPPSPDLITPLLGPRAIVDLKRKAFEEKYKTALELKAKKEGLASVEELKQREGEREMKAREEKRREREQAEKEREEKERALEGEGGKEKVKAAKKVEKQEGPIKVRSGALSLSKFGII